ncbi:MAG: phosphoenolpyruvate carboxylase [Nitrosomonadales bacterium]
MPLSPAETLAVVRAFSYFSQLSNIAEDLHHNRLHRANLKTGSALKNGSLQLALERIKERKIDKTLLQKFLDSMLVSPVLTAHPTEVQRKSILDCQLIISQLLSDRDRVEMTPDELAENDEALHRFVLILWQTRMLRTAKLTVYDEIKNGLEFYRYTFLAEIPKIYAYLEKHLEENFDKGYSNSPIASSGELDRRRPRRNPFVTHEVMRDAVRQHSALVFEHYLNETNVISARLSLTDRLVDVSDELRQLSDASPDNAVSRHDEPYRRALILIYSRLSATARQLGHEISHPPPLDKAAQPYASSQEFKHDLEVIIESLLKHGAVYVARGRIADLRRAAEVFGFHLAPLDMRQHSAIHEQTVTELFTQVGENFNYRGLNETARREVLLTALQSGKLLLQGIEKYSEIAQSELRIMQTAAYIHQRFGRAALPNHIISKTDAVSDMLELALMLQQVKLLEFGENPALHVNIIPLV